MKMQHFFKKEEGTVSLTTGASNSFGPVGQMSYSGIVHGLDQADGTLTCTSPPSMCQIQCIQRLIQGPCCMWHLSWLVRHRTICSILPFPPPPGWFRTVLCTVPCAAPASTCLGPALHGGMHPGPAAEDCSVWFVQWTGCWRAPCMVWIPDQPE